MSCEKETAADAEPLVWAGRGLFGGRRTRAGVHHAPDAPLLSVITVVFNGESTLEATLQSVFSQSYKNVEYIVVDGGSRDKTVEIIRRFEHLIDLWMSESDRGIYDAMNKGIRASTGQWLSFMNAGDVYSSDDTLSMLVNQYIRPRGETGQFFYSDVIVTRAMADGSKRRRLYLCDHRRKIINHQASVYARSLHELHGYYLVANGVTISDYIFFSLIEEGRFVKLAQPIAEYDESGASQSRRAVEQKFMVDYLLNGYPRGKFVACFLFYYSYRDLKRVLIELRQVVVGLALALRRLPGNRGKRTF